MKERYKQDWEAVIGLEVHVQLKTKSKIFSGASTAYGAEANTQACIIDLGFPGVLPVLNETAVYMAIKFGLSINAEVARRCVFARKNYFYPDLPKGYQISQHEHPIVANGTVKIIMPSYTKNIRIQRAHLEEDAGKSLHEDIYGLTAVDLNRAGTPLLEIVSEPDLSTAQEAGVYLKTLHSLVMYLDICDGNMQEGSFRCDANISVRRKNSKNFGTRVEVKNLNSFKFIEKAISYEINRQIETINNGGTILQETRLYDVNNDTTRLMRSKENANDYRYFPDPDLLPVCLDEEFINNIKKDIPELAPEKTARFMQQYSLSEQDATLLTSSRELAEFYEKTAYHTLTDSLSLNVKLAKIVCNWITGDLLGALNKHNLPLSQSPITPTILAKLITRISDKTISGKLAKEVFEIAWTAPTDPDFIIKEYNLVQLQDNKALQEIIEQIISNFPNQVAEYKNGKEQLLGFFVGQTMKASEGKANPQLVNKLIKEALEK